MDYFSKNRLIHNYLIHLLKRINLRAHSIFSRQCLGNKDFCQCQKYFNEINFLPCFKHRNRFNISQRTYDTNTRKQSEPPPPSPIIIVMIKTKVKNTKTKHWSCKIQPRIIHFLCDLIKFQPEGKIQNLNQFLTNRKWFLGHVGYTTGITITGKNRNNITARKLS